MTDKKYLAETKPEDANGNDLKKWRAELELAEKDQKEYLKRAKNVVKRYRDEDREEDKDETLPARFNVLWSNVEVQAPILFGRTPNVQVDRRFKDSDPVGRSACQIWERATQFCIDSYDFPDVMKAVVKDYQLAGRGTAWAIYEPAVEDDGISYQEASCLHVHFSEFLHSPSKNWQRVRWVGRKLYLNRKQLVNRFGQDIGSKVGLDYSARDNEEKEQSGRKKADEQEEFKQACIYEIWDSDSMEVIWLSKSYANNILDKEKDPLGLHNFFPTPKPLFATTTTETLIPVPDFVLYQDQARELDLLTMKIDLLEDSLRCVGFFDATYNKELSSLYQGTKNNEMIPITNWQKLQAAGGIKGIAEWMELGQVIEALNVLYPQRTAVKQDIYELTGISDLVRGGNSGQELTATEVRKRGNMVTLRLRDRKADVERYARDLIALQGEIIAEHFEPGIIAAMCGVNLLAPDVQQNFMQALALLKNDPMRSFRLTLETDSMAALDEAEQQESATEFVQGLGTMFDGGIKAIQAAPIIAPMVGEAIMLYCRRFKAGRSMEYAVEQASQGLVQMAQKALTSPPPPDPEMIKVQGKMQLEQQQSQNDFQLKQAELQQRAQLEQSEMQNRMQLETVKNGQEIQVARERNAAEIQAMRERNQAELALKREMAQLELDLKVRELAVEAGLKGQEIEMKAEVQREANSAKAQAA